jgi:DNA-binding NarL/FixJ family response regulator
MDATFDFPADDSAPMRTEQVVVSNSRQHDEALVRVAVDMKHALARAALVQLLEATPDLALVDDHDAAGVLVVDLDAAPDTEAGEWRRQNLSPRTAVVGLTASTSAERIIEALRAGIASVVSTAAPPADLLRAIRTAAAGEMYFDARVASVLVSRIRARGKPGAIDEQRGRFAELSEREQTVLRLVAEGRTGPEIGRLLGITAKTVDTYRHRIHEKIGLTHRRDYIHFALQIGLLES